MTDYISNIIEKVVRFQREYREQTIAKIVTDFDFIVGSPECKHRLMEVLPEGANVICSPFIANSTTIYVIKKFDVLDLIKEPYKAESDDEL